MVKKKIFYVAHVSHPTMNLYIAASDKGLVYVGTEHSSFEKLEQYCRKLYPDCKIIHDEKFIQPYASQFIEYLNGKRKQFTLPFDLHGTPFQRKVWEALCSIPYGKTAAYSDVAMRIGKPEAVRAVGGAIGANPLPIIIPCHRVIGKNGKLTGYSGGLDVKEKVLSLESAFYGANEI